MRAKTVETHVRKIFISLDLHPEPEDHRRVMAVLMYLGARSCGPGCWPARPRGDIAVSETTENVLRRFNEGCGRSGR